MKVDLKPIDYLHMTWKQVFETIQSNIDSLYDAILSTYTSMEIEQFDGGTDTITIETPVDEGTEWLIFRNDMFLGKMDGGEGYVVSDQTIIFDTALENDESATVIVVSGNTLSVLANKYVDEIKSMYDTLKDLDIDVTQQIENVNSLKSLLDESALGIIDAKNSCANYKDYIEQLIQGTTPTQGEFADEIVAARRGEPLIGARLDKFVSTALEKQVFLNSTNYRDGDWVFVKDSSSIYLYLVKDEYTGELQHEVMNNGQIAVILMSLEDYTTVSDLKNRVSSLEEENRTYKEIVDRLVNRVSELENLHIGSRLQNLEDVAENYSERNLLDISISQQT